ncbi:MAG: DUF3857 and transglutaminase domain-containing protein [Bacteroidia bacterium]|nr:DUF3857 and transglutaminase domain-containing protein [Bacteroidia bacterium]
MQSIKLSCIAFLSIWFSDLHAQPNNMLQCVRYKIDYPDADLLIVFDSTMTNVKESGLSYVNRHILYKILTPKGAMNLSVIKYDYDPQTAYVEILTAVIYHKNGEAEELNIKNVKDYPAPAHMIFWGARQKMLEIGRLEPEEHVEISVFRKGFTYALLQPDDDERYIPPMRGHFYDIVEFWNEAPVIEKVYNIYIPDSKTVRYQFYNGLVDTAIIHKPGIIQYIFTMRNIMPLKKEPQMVAFSDVAPKLLISTSPDWKCKSKWFYSVNENYGSFESTPEIKKKVEQILQGAKDQTDTISRLTHWAADEIRYSGISMGKGEGYTLHKGEMTFTDRCGVCKDKAGMLITLLRAAGFKSYPAMTMAGSRIDDIPADQFNHCVVIVKLSDGQYHLLDPTWVPFVRELWSSAEQQQNYLMGLPEGADLMITPLSPPENHYFRITGSSELLSDGTLKGQLVVTAEGQSDAMLRRMFVRNYKAEWNNLIQSELIKSAPKISLSSIKFNNPYDYSSPLSISIEYQIPEYAVITDEEIIFIPLAALNLFSKYTPHIGFDTKAEKKEFPFKDRCSRLVEIEETVKLPYPAEIAFLPDTLKSNGSGADFEGWYSCSNQSFDTAQDKYIKLHERAAYKKRVYEPDDWPSYREAILLQNRFAKEYIILKKIPKN